MSGYYEQALDVLKVCLGSIYEHTEYEYDLFIFDNASCSEVRSFLTKEHNAGRIRYLTLSEENLGKAAAWKEATNHARLILRGPAAKRRA